MTASSTVGQELRALRRTLRGAGIETWSLDARLLIADALRISPQEVFAYPDRSIDATVQRRLRKLADRRLAHEPMAYILQRREFWSLPFRVGPATLVPRPETELLVSAVLRHMAVSRRAARILDLGTGSGCILLSLLHELPDAYGIGVDVDEQALRVAQANAVNLGIARQSDFVCGDWTEALSGQFDAIVANPPYIPSGDLASLIPEVQRFEPRQALDGGIDGLDAYRRILDGIRNRRLAGPQTRIVLEIAAAAVEKLGVLVRRCGYSEIALEKDLAGHPRCLIIENVKAKNEEKVLGKRSVPV